MEQLQEEVPEVKEEEEEEAVMVAKLLESVESKNIV